MFLKQFKLLSLILGSLAVSESALGQYDPPGYAIPLSNTGGSAGDEMRRIYRADIGNGYSGADLNRMTQNAARGGIPNVGQSSAPRIGLGSGSSGGRISKPFSNFNPSPTVSPYLNLFRDDFEGNDDFNYQTLVRPQLEQQRVNEQLQRQNMDTAQRLQAMSAAPDFNPAGNQNQAPTGHQTVFMYYGHYYPAMNRSRR